MQPECEQLNWGHRSWLFETDLSMLLQSSSIDVQPGEAASAFAFILGRLQGGPGSRPALPLWRAGHLAHVLLVRVLTTSRGGQLAGCNSLRKQS